ncbi:acetyl-CoA C-acetyltransferase [Pseudonocardia sp.]|uniref:acetyl-CoA C-acetyltransferase n=1 Tax=Pseudonocardia sp. TaxID=60912 RepID=UPI003D101D3B
MREPVIVATARSPIGRAFKGKLKDVRGDDMVAAMITAALDRVPALDHDLVEDVIIGTGSPQNEQAYNIARVASLLAGLPDVPGVTVNRYCSSSLQAIRMAAHAVAAGEGDAFVAGGVESVSRYPQRIPDPDGFENPRFDPSRHRSAERALGGVEDWEPQELPDAYVEMGQTAENVRILEGVTREEMDAFALASQQRAADAIEDGFFAREITPLTLADGTVVDTDESPRPATTAEGLAGLKPAFRPDGEVTAGNSCPLNDGAAAVVVMDRSRAERIGITPLARIVSTAVTGVDPEIMGLGPVTAIPRALRRAGLTVADLDLVEINEAFAAQVIPSARRLGIPHDVLNVHGGAIALGHPFGMTGARMTTTLINGLDRVGGRYGVVSMCVGGGQGMAMVLERL